MFFYSEQEAQQTIVTEGLQLHLDAGDTNSYPGTGTTWYDLSGNGIDGTLVNGVGYDNGYGGSLNFDGVDDKVTFPNTTVDTTNGITVQLWFKTSSTTKYQDIFDVADAYGVWIVTRYGKIRTGFTLDVGHIEYPISYSANTWYNVCLSGTGTSNYQFINGEQTGTASRTVSTSVNFNTARIGNVDGDRASEYLVGNVALLKFYNRALTPAEVQQNFNATKDRFGL